MKPPDFNSINTYKANPFYAVKNAQGYGATRAWDEASPYQRSTISHVGTWQNPGPGPRDPEPTERMPGWLRPQGDPDLSDPISRDDDLPDPNWHWARPPGGR